MYGRSHIDSAVLQSLQDVMAEDYPALLDAYLGDSEERLHSLRQALRDGNAEALSKAAHSFKGSCSNLGAAALADLCCQLETLAREQRLVEAPAMIERIEREFAIVGILFRAERQRYG